MRDISKQVAINGKMFFEGDLLCSSEKDGKFGVSKILRIDDFGKGYAFHCALWDEFDHPPSLEEIKATPLFIKHISIAGESYVNAKNLGNLPIQKAELDGFFEYLKQTNFQRYMKETGQKPKDLVPKIQSLWQAAYQAGKEKRHEDAIRLYTELLEIWPNYYEAFDNRGFAEMDLGRFKDAIKSFDESLRIAPKGTHALFFKGECLLRLGRVHEAIKQFAEAIKVEPALRSSLDKLLHMSFPISTKSTEFIIDGVHSLLNDSQVKKSSSLLDYLGKFFRNKS